MYSAPPPSVGSVDTTSAQPQTNTRSTVFPLQNLRSSLPEPDVASYWKSVKSLILRYLHLLWFTLKRVAEYFELNYAPIPKALSTNSLYRILARQSLSYESLSHERVLDHVTNAASAGSCDVPETVLHVLKSLPVGDIWISQDQHNPLSNRVKDWIEDTTKVAWNWWPLEQPKQVLGPGETRIFWNCPCGSTLWEDLTSRQYEQVQRVMFESLSQPREPYWCPKRRSRNYLPIWGTSLSSQTSQSRASQMYIPQDTPTQSSAESTSLPHRTLPLAGVDRLTEAQRDESDMVVRIAPTLTAGWILVGVERGARMFPVSQVLVNHYSTDCSVFQEIDMNFRKARGRLRLLFSIWRLRNYESVKFWRVTLRDMVPDYKDLPQSPDYKYTPRAGDGAKNPPISNHVFERLSFACKTPCNRRLPHDCIPEPSRSSFCERIPKRDSPFERDMTEFIWGLEAQSAVSALYVLAYHIVILLGPFVFWWCWLQRHGGDLQGAGVPITIALGALSLFWSAGGLLTHGKAS